MPQEFAQGRARGEQRADDSQQPLERAQAETQTDALDQVR